MDKAIRVLHVLHGLGSGGAEMVVMNWYRGIDRQKIQFDFLLRSSSNVYADEIERYGGKVFVMPEYPRHWLNNRKQTARFLDEHPEYRIIHVHANALIYTDVLRLARQKGIPCRIMHSHNTHMASAIYRPIHELHKHTIEQDATDYLACSKEAGLWMFPSGNFQVVPNGIDLNRFRFDGAVRDQYRKELGLDGHFVLGHAGRFLAQKNHGFLLKVFGEVCKREPDALLLLCGEGPLENKLRQTIQSMGLEQRVRFLGVRRDMPALMQAMDVFVFPSRFEGLGIVLIEAQACGLPCIASDCVPPEAAVTDDYRTLPLSLAPAQWADAVIAWKGSPRKDNTALIRQKNYDISSIASWMQDYYLSKYSESDASAPRAGAK